MSMREFIFHPRAHKIAQFSRGGDGIVTFLVKKLRFSFPSHLRIIQILSLSKEFELK